MRIKITAGIAIFSMFFGAGNVIFPLLVGVKSGSQVPWALLGLLITAIGGPILGLIGGTLFQGNCKAFFARLGKWPGMIVMLLCLGLLGPFAVLPRCILVAHASSSGLLTLPQFALLFGALTLFCSLQKGNLLGLLGKILSPILLLSLIAIIFSGSQNTSALQASNLSAIQSLKLGLTTGYDTMDLIAAIFFSAGIWSMLAPRVKDVGKSALIAGLIGGSLLGIIYVGLCLTAAYHGPALQHVEPEQLMTTLAQLTLGPHLTPIANIAIVLACLTTIISLTTTLSEILANDLLPFHSQTIVYAICAISTLLSMIGFGPIMHLIHSAVSLLYPFIILLTIYNVFIDKKRLPIQS